MVLVDYSQQQAEKQKQTGRGEVRLVLRHPKLPHQDKLINLVTLPCRQTSIKKEKKKEKVDVFTSFATPPRYLLRYQATHKARALVFDAM